MDGKFTSKYQEIFIKVRDETQSITRIHNKIERKFFRVNSLLEKIELAIREKEQFNLKKWISIVLLLFVN